MAIQGLVRGAFADIDEAKFVAYDTGIVFISIDGGIGGAFRISVRRRKKTNESVEDAVRRKIFEAYPGDDTRVDEVVFEDAAMETAVDYSQRL